MGFRFRKSFKIAPGVRVNVGKKSIGMSIGGKRGGLSFNSKTGTRARVSIPGTGISYSTKLGGGKRKRGRKKSARKNHSSHVTKRNTTPVCLRWWYIVLIVVFAIGGFGNLGANLGAAIFDIAVAVIMSFLSIRVIRRRHVSNTYTETQPEEKKQPEAVLDELDNAKDFYAIAKTLSENGIISQPEDNFHNSFGDDLRHLAEDGELPRGWVHHYQEFINSQEKTINNRWEAVYSAPSVQEKLDAYREYFNTVTKVGATCKETGECHYKWFCEAIIGSVWYNNHLKEYEKLKEDAPLLIKRESLRANLESDVMAKLQSCNGILQSEFLKTFDPLIKDDVSIFLREADKTGKITRTKSGRSYILGINS